MSSHDANRESFRATWMQIEAHRRRCEHGWTISGLDVEQAAFIEVPASSSLDVRTEDDVNQDVRCRFGRAPIVVDTAVRAYMYHRWCGFPVLDAYRFAIDSLAALAGQQREPFVTTFTLDQIERRTPETNGEALAAMAFGQGSGFRPLCSFQMAATFWTCRSLGACVFDALMTAHDVHFRLCPTGRRAQESIAELDAIADIRARRN